MDEVNGDLTAFLATTYNPGLFSPGPFVVVPIIADYKPENSNIRLKFNPTSISRITRDELVSFTSTANFPPVSVRPWSEHALHVWDYEAGESNRKRGDPAWIAERKGKYQARILFVFVAIHEGVCSMRWRTFSITHNTLSGMDTRNAGLDWETPLLAFLRLSARSTGTSTTVGCYRIL